MTTTTTDHKCSCGGSLESVDTHLQSLTARCTSCQRCMLIVSDSRLGIEASIALRDFHLKRGDGPQQRPLSDLGMATRLVDCLFLDLWPTPAMVVDYGIDTAEHSAALQCAVCKGVTAYDLDRVIGDGPAITQLVQAVPDQIYPHIQFQTAYDALPWDVQDFGD